jgi:hypothetical protein
MIFAGYMFAYNSKYDPISEKLKEAYQNTADKSSTGTVDLAEFDDLDVTIVANIVDVYSITLNRMPTPSELRRNHEKIANQSINYDTLKTILEGSSEYARMIRMQTNVYQGDMVPRFTERQLELVVAKLYKETFGYAFDDAEREFLIRKYRYFQMDDEKMRKFLMVLREFLDGEDMAKGTAGAPNAASGSGKLMDQLKVENFVDTDMNPSNTGTSNRNELGYVTLDSLTERPNTHCRSRKGGTDWWELPFFANETDNAADYVARRNKDELGFACAHSTPPEDSDAMWSLLQPDTDWIMPLKNSGEFTPAGVSHVLASRDFTRLTGTLLNNVANLSDDQPTLPNSHDPEVRKGLDNSSTAPDSQA